MKSSPIGFLALGVLLLVATTATAEEQTVKALVVPSVVLRPMVEAEAPARRAGVLVNLAVEEGAQVETGDLLASLDDRAAVLAERKAKVERDQIAAKAQNDLRIQYADKALEVARAELKRSADSIAQFAKSISQSQLDVERLTVEKLELERQQAEKDVAQDELELKLKEAALAEAELEVELHAVRAPFSGVVSLIRGRAGEWVEPGEKVARLVAINRLRAEGFAPAASMSDLKVGVPVEFVVESGGAAQAAVFHGKLNFVSPEVDAVTGQVRIWAAIDNRDKLLHPGDKGVLRIISGLDVK